MCDAFEPDSLWHLVRVRVGVVTTRSKVSQNKNFSHHLYVKAWQSCLGGSRLLDSVNASNTWLVPRKSWFPKLCEVNDRRRSGGTPLLAN